MQEPCQHFLLKGTCKFGSRCHFSHRETLVRSVPTLHPHLVGPDPVSKRKKFFCDECGQKRTEGGFRCAAGCDYDLCPACMEANAVAIDHTSLIAAVTSVVSSGAPTAASRSQSEAVADSTEEK